MMAKKIKKTTAFNIVCKNMPHTTKLFCQMQASQSGKKKKGRRFTLDEKILALSLYKPSPKALSHTQQNMRFTKQKNSARFTAQGEFKMWNQ